ncbi:MAG: hypothetical protein U1E56_00270 [Bauldia sp.]
METLVARLNVRNFRQMLAEETDPQRRAQILRLLREAEERLQATPVAQRATVDRPTAQGG